jgi:VWFA-related protein
VKEAGVLGRVAILTGLAAMLIAAQDQPPRPTFRTEANYVRVDVYPTTDDAPVMDLTQGDFEILEDKAPQKIEQFEHVVVRGNLPQETRIEPNSVRDMQAMLENSRARVFVVFLDVYHVEVDGSYRIRQPLIDALNRLVGPDDLVAVMTPEMSAKDLAFARRTTTVEGLLTRYWNWGERQRLNPTDPEESQYEACYPNHRDIVIEMAARRREKRTLDALRDLAVYLRGVREERKAVITVTDGWRLFKPNPDLARSLRDKEIPGTPHIFVDPRTGRPTTNNPQPAANSQQINDLKCDSDRLHLAQIDDERDFRETLDVANAGNVSFYPIDPRGLVVFDGSAAKGTDIGGFTSEPPLKPGLEAAVDRGGASASPDAAILRQRLVTLRTLAEATDGIAIVNNNDLSRGFKRIVDDLSSYYLLGYYSTGKLDGKFHSITVRVKRPGVQIRARRGYVAATPRAINAAAATAAASATPAKADAEAAAIIAAISPLAGYVREVPLRVQAAVGWRPGDQASAAVWVEGELSGAREFDETWKGGALATIELARADGPSLASARATIAAGARTFRLALTPSQPLEPGDYIVRVGARGTDATISTRDTMHIAVPPRPQASGAIWIRRGQTTGNRDAPTADLRFRRSEQVKVEIPTIATDAGPARLLDRAGKALGVPVATAIRDDADGSRWVTAQVALAPLAAGDYVIELSEGNNRMLAAFRLVP